MCLLWPFEKGSNEAGRTARLLEYQADNTRDIRNTTPREAWSNGAWTPKV